VPRALSLCYAQIMKFSAREIAQATGGLIIDGSPEALCDGVSTDSRTIRPGQLFVPLRGSRCDGHEFIADARARGAAGVLLQTPPPAPPRPDFIWTVHLAAFGGKTNGPGEAWSPSPFRGEARGEVIGVPDTARALSDLARWAVKKLNKPIIAVAGSNGKTTTKELLAHVLSQRFRTHATAGNYNTEIGLALTVLNAPDDTELLVLEMGTTSQGDIAKFCEIAPPTVGVLTSISEEHTATLGDLESVIKAETELLEALPTRGLAVINGDDTQLITIARRKARCPVITFGFAPHNDLIAEELKISRAGTRFYLRSPRWQNELQISLLGRPAVLAALAATAVAQHFELSFSEIRRGLMSARPAWGRLQIVSIPETALTVLHDAYNANPASMREAILCAAQIRHPDEELIFVLGDMLELGALSERAHREIGRFLATGRVRPDRLIVVGKWARLIGEEAARAGLSVYYCSTSDEVAQVLSFMRDRRCLILLKGSRGMRLERVLDILSQQVLVSV
jgi:UDP-N-acetylmuramoyl-tripeptide--D-alanyl-D-alanine ligase